MRAACYAREPLDQIEAAFRQRFEGEAESESESESECHPSAPLPPSSCFFKSRVGSFLENRLLNTDRPDLFF